MAIGECSAYSSLQADSKVRFSAWRSTWWPNADWLSLRGPKVSSRIWLRAQDDSTISFVLRIIIIIIVIIIRPM